MAAEARRTRTLAAFSGPRPPRPDEVGSGVRLVVAGGLDPENVGAAVARLRPDIVDVSSGVEESVGIKASDRVRRFIAMARGAAAPRAGEASGQ